MLHIVIPSDIFSHMKSFGESGYPEEVAGLTLGVIGSNEEVDIRDFFAVANNHEMEIRYHYYQISHNDWVKGEAKAEQLGLQVVGVFHTHPDHPSEPSQTDLENALPNLIYFIASVYKGKGTNAQAWKLREDRTQFDECFLRVM